MKDMTSEDITRTYADTFIGMRRGDLIVPVRVYEGRDYNRAAVSVGGEETSIIDINDPTLVYTFPDSGAYNLKKGTAFFASRKPERQWHRGVRDRALRITGSVGFSSEMVAAMYNPKYYSLEEAVQILGAKEGSSVAISRDFWFWRDPHFENILIYLRGRCVGEMDLKGDCTISSPIIKQLYEEALKDAA